MGEEVTVTYETLYELYRLEKDRAEIQELPATFFADVAAYLSEKEASLHMAQGSIFDNEAQKARIQMENVKKILRALYDRRETKILNMAMVKARTQNIVNMQPLLDPEKDLYHSVVGILNMYRGGILQSLMLGNSVGTMQRAGPAFPKHPPSGISAAATTTLPAHDHFAIAPQNEHPSPADQKQPSLVASDRDASPPDLVSTPDRLEAKTVRFLCAVPKFVGPNLEVYGPFSGNDVATLPAPIVNVLLSKNRVEMQGHP